MSYALKFGESHYYLNMYVFIPFLYKNSAGLDGWYVYNNG